MIKDIAFVGYPVTDMKKARGFYEGLLGLSPSEEFGPVTDESSFIEYTVGNSTLSLGKMDGWKPSRDGASAALEVEDLDVLFSKLKGAGIEVVLEIQTFSSCKMAVVRDPDGNQVTLHQKTK